jgi:hypothetical protein
MAFMEVDLYKLIYRFSAILKPELGALPDAGSKELLCNSASDTAPSN